MSIFDINFEAQKRCNKLLNNPVYLFELLFSKYGDLDEEYNILQINHLIFDKPCHYNVQFKDFLYFYTPNDFLQRFYSKEENKNRIQRLSNHYIHYQKFFCRPFYLNDNLGRLLRDCEDEKAEIFNNIYLKVEIKDYMQKNNYKLDVTNSNNDNNNNKINSGSLSSLDNITNNKLIFDKTTKNIIDNNIDSKCISISLNTTSFFYKKNGSGDKNNNGTLSKNLISTSSKNDSFKKEINNFVNCCKNKKKLTKKGQILRKIYINNKEINTKVKKIYTKPIQNKGYVSINSKKNNNKILNNNKINYNSININNENQNEKKMRQSNNNFHTNVLNKNHNIQTLNQNIIKKLNINSNNNVNNANTINYTNNTNNINEIRNNNTIIKNNIFVIPRKNSLNQINIKNSNIKQNLKKFCNHQRNNTYIVNENNFAFNINKNDSNPEIRSTHKKTIKSQSIENKNIIEKKNSIVNIKQFYSTQRSGGLFLYKKFNDKNIHYSSTRDLIYHKKNKTFDVDDNTCSKIAITSNRTGQNFYPKPSIYNNIFKNTEKKSFSNNYTEKNIFQSMNQKFLKILAMKNKNIKINEQFKKNNLKENVSTFSKYTFLSPVNSKKQLHKIPLIQKLTKNSNIKENQGYKKALSPNNSGIKILQKFNSLTDINKNNISYIFNNNKANDFYINYKIKDLKRNLSKKSTVSRNKYATVEDTISACNKDITNNKNENNSLKNSKQSFDVNIIKSISLANQNDYYRDNSNKHRIIRLNKKRKKNDMILVGKDINKRKNDVITNKKREGFNKNYFSFDKEMNNNIRIDSKLKPINVNRNSKLISKKIKNKK